ncbi:MAG: hypothetical protein IJS54_02650 [Desulfovibrio sp.]|nr:hypothetical protein [Desulfovibrio sp.]
MSATSFEFLAAADDWEEACKYDPKHIDENPRKDAWTFAGEMLNVLAPFKEGKAGITKQSLASLAKDGENASRNNTPIRGFPGIVKERIVSKGNWEDFAAPSPSLLDDLPDGCVLIKVDVTLLSPWYSRDDLSFYPTENPLRRHRVFDIPFLSASGIKGLLHWAYCMANKTLADNEITRLLFGSIDGDTGQQGLLYCYPLYFEGKLGLEVINPQDLKTGAGTNPIKYEVLLPGKTGTLFFLLTNLPARPPLTSEHIQTFLTALHFLLECGGLSAKSSAGWGRVAIKTANAAIGGMETPKAQSDQFQEKTADAAWQVMLDADGNLLPLEGNDQIFTNKRIKALLPDCSGKMLKDRQSCYTRIVALFNQRKNAQANAASKAGQKQNQWLLKEEDRTFETFSKQLLTLYAARESRA